MTDQRRSEWAYILALLLPAAALLARISLGNVPGNPPALIFFIIPITLCAYLGGLRPGALCTIVSALLTVFFLSDLARGVSLFSGFQFAQWSAFLITGLVISYLAERLLQSQERLRVDESRLSGMFNSAMDGIISVDEDLSVIYINPAAEKMFGYSTAALVGTSARKLVPESHQRLCQRLIRNLAVSGALHRMVEGPVVGVRADGSQFPVEATISKVETQGRQLFTLVIRDVSERKLAETALREREALYRSLFESLDEGVILWDADGRIEACNAAAERILGYVAQQLIGTHFTDIPWRPRSPGDAQFNPQQLAIAIIQRTGEAVPRRERCFVRADGAEIWVQQTGIPLRLDGTENRVKVITCFTDITESRQKSAAISQMAAIVANSRDAIISKKLDGTILTWNPGAEALSGYTAQEAIGRTAAQLLLRPEYHEAESKVRARIAQGEPVRTFDIEILRKDGQPVQTQITASPIRDANGNIIGISQIARDVTERRRTEQALRERDAAEEASRLKSEFLANMSHELRTPLNGIIGFTEYLKAAQAGPINEEQAESLDSIYKSSQHLLDLINGVLDLSKIEAGKMELNPETFSVRELVSEVCGVISPLAAKKHIAVDERVAADVTTVTLDRGKFRQVLYNLLSNAVKFTSPDGKVGVDVDQAEGRRLRVRVSDNGIGIAAEDVDKLFRTFHQLDSSITRRHEGAGLGLALTKKIVELQHGTITVQSAPGRGSVFTVLLPY